MTQRRNDKEALRPHYFRIRNEMRFRIEAILRYIERAKSTCIPRDALINIFDPKVSENRLDSKLSYVSID